MENSSPMRQRAHRYISGFLTLIMVLLAFGSGIFVGEGIVARRFPAGGRIANVDSQKTEPTDDVDFNQFWEVWNKVKSKYVKQPVKDSDLYYGALQGMVYGLNDPYSVFFPPKEASDFQKSLAGEFAGIGAEVGVKNNQLLIIAPLPNTPAEKAGLRPGDKILAIDKLSTVGMDVGTAVEHIRGPATSSVKLTILRAGWEKPNEITIHRATINVPAVMYEMKPGKVAYLRIMQFNEKTVQDFSKYIEKAKESGATGLILDLRNNPGGLLDAAVAMASEWVESGKIVSERFSNGEENVHQTIGEHRLAGMKTVVLVNGGSASASEIVAGALQDHKAAKLIGEKTYGKGSVQDYEILSDGSALKVTVAEWYTPNGNNINKTGVKPDIEVKEDFAKEKVGEDVMVSRAMQELKK